MVSIKSSESGAYPCHYNVRLVRVRLRTGEYERVAGCHFFVQDETRYPSAGFLELYYLRCFDRNLLRLDQNPFGTPENFTGTGAEADVVKIFHATVYLSGLESLVDSHGASLDLCWTQIETQHPLNGKPMPYPSTRLRIWRLILLLGDHDTDTLLEKLTAFVSN